MEIKSKLSKLKEDIKLIIPYGQEISGRFDIGDQEVLRDDIEENIIELISYVERKYQTFSEQLLNTLNTIIIHLYDEIQVIIKQKDTVSMSDQLFFPVLNVITSLETELNRIRYLSILGDKNIVLIGANGAGKSSFASYLKDSVSETIVVIPAQKFLFYDRTVENLVYTDKNTLSAVQNNNLINKQRFDYNDDYEARNFNKELSEIFPKLITTIINEQVKEDREIIEISDDIETLSTLKNNTIFYKFIDIWKKIIPDITFRADTTNRTLIPIRNGKEFRLNSMSDGEKVILYYIANIILAEPNSFIIIDEPETFLNPSNFNRLWNVLENSRDDCRFVYISHTIDFVTSRENADLFWCKEFNYPHDWKIEKIKENKDTTVKTFERALLVELLGSRKPILFCEGDRESLDVFLYNSIFHNEVVIIPVKGHRQVIDNTRAFNKSQIYNSVTAYGIIDGDLHSESQMKAYEADNVFVLPFNEIEMLLLSEEVIEDVLNIQYEETEVQEKIINFKKEFVQYMSKHIERICHIKGKMLLENFLNEFKIEKNESAEAMLKIIEEKLKDLNLELLMEEFKEKLTLEISNENYSELLTLCPLKNEISKPLANKYLMSDYVEFAKRRIKIDKDLSEILRLKYFQSIMFKTEEID